MKLEHIFSPKLIKEASKRNLKLIGAGGGKRYRKYRFLDCRHVQDIQTSCVRTKDFYCTRCKSEEDSKKEEEGSNVYILKITSGGCSKSFVNPTKVDPYSWLKLGYSKSISRRLRQYDVLNCKDVVAVSHIRVPTRTIALRIEKNVHKICEPRRLPPEVMKKYHTTSGHTECYSVDIGMELQACIITVANMLIE